MDTRGVIDTIGIFWYLRLGLVISLPKNTRISIQVHKHYSNHYEKTEELYAVVEGFNNGYLVATVEYDNKLHHIPLTEIKAVFCSERLLYRR